MAMRILDAIRNHDSRDGRLFDYTIISLILISIVTLSIETVPGLTKQTMLILRLTEVFITIVFTIEYLLRVAASEKKSRYIFSFYGIVDFIAILPFYLALGFDLRGLRAFRLFRLVRLLKLNRYSHAMDKFGKAVILVKEEVVLFLGATAILLFLSATGIYYFENTAQPENFQSIPHSLWWAVSTLSTVGYGDVYPITIAGKIFTFAILMIGLGIVAVPAGLVASALSEVRRNEKAEAGKDIKNKDTGAV
ncbi:MAG: ion transporter [Acidiferrobacterales bacterium]|nr:ion transporter [Acidiferrobacterales bacterium]